jgi:hypothetical protein
MKACTRCFELTALRRQAAQRNDLDEMKQLEAEMKEHQDIQYAERDLFHQRRDYLLKNDTDTTSLALDATFDVNFPNIPQDSNLKRKIPKLNVHAFTIIHHSSVAENGGYMCFYIGGNKETSNFDISYLDWCLRRLKSKGLLRKRLELQLDSGATLKNRVMIGYLSYIVHLGWVEEVEVCFLIAGHTGEAIDGLTAKFRQPLRFSVPCYSGADFLRRWKDFFPNEKPPAPFFFADFGGIDHWTAMPGLAQPVEHLVRDWASFLRPYTENVSGFSGHNAGMSHLSIHVWKLRKNNKNEVEMVVRRLRSLSSDFDSEPVVVSRSFSADSAPIPVNFSSVDYPEGSNPVEVCKYMLGDSSKLISKSDKEWWTWLSSGLERWDRSCLIPSKKKKKTREKVVVLLSDIPKLKITGKRRKKEDVAAEFGDESSESEGEIESEGDEFDGDDPEYLVHSLKDRRVAIGEDGKEEVQFLVQYGGNYLNEEPSWQPLQNLAGAMRMVDEYERLHSHQRDEAVVGGGLSDKNKAASELAHQVRDEENRKKSKKDAKCPDCGKEFTQRGLTTHKRSCKKKRE